MAKYIPGRNYIGSSEIATDLDVTGPATFADTVTFSGNIISNVKISDSEGPYLNLYRDDNIIRSGNHLGSIVFGGGPEAYQESPLADSAIVLKAEAADDAAANNAPSKLTIQGVNDSSAALSDWVVLDGDLAKISFYQAIEVGVDDTGYDVIFRGATSGRFLHWDESADRLQLADNTTFYLGSGFDLGFFHNGTNSEIVNNTGDLTIKNQADDKDVILMSDDGSGGTTAYLTLDGSAGYTTVQKNMNFADDIKATFGNSNDLKIDHDSAGYGYIQNLTGHLYFVNGADDKDIIFQSDDGSGGAVTYFRLDGSDTSVLFSKTLKVVDSAYIGLGDSFDFHLQHNGTDSKITNSTGDLYIINGADDKDIIFQSDDGSGGVETYLLLDGSGSRAIVPTNKLLGIGNFSDMYFKHNGTNSEIVAQNGDLYITNSADDKDIIFQSDDGSGGTETYFFLDGSIGLTTFPDNKKLAFGSGNDLQIKHNGTDGFITNVLGNLNISTSSDNSDIIFSSDDGSGGTETYFFLDGSSGGSNAQTIFPDNSYLLLGTGSDLELFHNGTNSYIDNNTGDLYIRQEADDKDIVFRCDDGSGGSTTYLQLDGSDLSVNILTQKLVIANLPTSNPGVDGQIWNNSGVLNVSSG